MTVRPYRTDHQPSFAFVPVDGPASHPVERAMVPRIMVDTVHDGDYIPQEFLTNRHGDRIDEDELTRHFVHERDWGANRVAHRVVSALGLGGYHRVNVARVLMDFGRFPGSSHRDHGHLHRFAINIPFTDFLGHAQKRAVLETHYDGVSRAMDEVVQDRLIKISIHTYDPTNASGTLRPQMSIATRAHAYQHDSMMPFGVFDALYPDILGEYTCDRILRDRLSLTLEKSGIPVAHNYPYLLPEGSIEVRSQVWFFFNHLRDEFERAHPDTRDKRPYELVWDMLHDTNLRSTGCEELRAYLHAFRKPPEGRREEFEAALAAYENVADFLRADERVIVDRYRFSPKRPNSMAIEVRKDLVWRFKDDGTPIGPIDEHIALIGDAIAKAVATYVRDDRVPHTPSGEAFERLEPWYEDSDEDHL